MTPIELIAVATAVLFCFYAGVIVGRLKARQSYRRGFKDGYAHAREIPIGHFRRMSINHDGINGVVELAEDVVIVPDAKGV